MTRWLTHATDLIRAKTPLVLVTVCGVAGSTPRDAGAKMIVTHDEQWGTIGGGNLEFSAIARAKTILASDQFEAFFDDYPLGPAFGQCCGGRVRISYERLGLDDLSWLQQAIEVTKAGGTVVLERSLSEISGIEQAIRKLSDSAPLKEGDGQEAPAFSFIDANGIALPASMPPIEECAGVREYIVDTRARIFIFGAGHVGGAIVKILQQMPVHATWIDRRADQLPPNMADNIASECSDCETAIAKGAPAGACFLVLTHDHQLDYDLVLEILNRGDSAYCGLIGSRTKRARFERRLQRAGIDEARLRDLTCPIGANGLNSKKPEMIALSTVHEMFLAHQAYNTAPMMEI